MKRGSAACTAEQHCTAAEYHVWVYLGSIDQAVGIGVFCVTGQGVRILRTCTCCEVLCEGAVKLFVGFSVYCCEFLCSAWPARSGARYCIKCYARGCQHGVKTPAHELGVHILHSKPSLMASASVGVHCKAGMGLNLCQKLEDRLYWRPEQWMVLISGQSECQFVWGMWLCVTHV
jgi:hypothetical protein